MTTATDFNATERVAAGAAYLDDSNPGWVERIDLDKLELAAPCGCILGQLDGGYWTALYRRYLNDADAIALGFTTDQQNPNVRAEAAEWDALEAAWRELILARRSEAGS